MVKEKRILSYFIGWLILGLFICFVGITKTNALVIDSKFLGYSNNGNFGISSGNYVSGNSFITVDQSNALNYYVVDMCTTLNNLFTITNISNQSGNVSLYKTYSYLGSCNTDNYTGQLARIYFKINQWADAGNGNFGVIFSSRLNNTANYYGDNKIINIYTTNEIDNTSEIINNQTNELNNSINNSTNTITGSIGDAENNINQNIDDMEQSIVDSNKETQDVIKDQFNTCRDSLNLFNKNTAILSSYIDTSGQIISPANNFAISDFISVNQNETYTYSGSHMQSSFGAKGAYYDENKNFISYFNMTTSRTITIPEGTYYVRFSLRSSSGDLNTFQFQKGSVATKYEAYDEKVCTNKLDETNDALNNIGGALTDSSAPNTSGLENSAGWLPAGPLDSILNLPLTMLNSLTNSLSKTCSPLNLTLPYVNRNIQIPCLSAIFAKITGVNELWAWVGTIASVLILYNYLLNLYAWVDRVLTLRAEFDEAMGADLANWGRL